MKTLSSNPLLFAAGIALSSECAHATLFQAIAPAEGTINSSGSLVENGVTYQAIFKPTTPPPSWVKQAWISDTGGYNGDDAIGFEVDPQAPLPGSGTPTDKTQLRVSHADDSSALTISGNTRYLGFAVDLPSAGVQAPTLGVVQLAQWWQGSPYGPPLALVISGRTANSATYKLQVFNDTTLGNPSSVPVVIGTGTLPFDSWNTFVTRTTMGFNNNGHVQLWENGSMLFDWTGSVGYDPTTIPYKNPPQGTVSPNNNFDVFIGPYRDEQPTQQVEYFDQIRWADTLADATPLAPMRWNQSAGGSWNTSSNWTGGLPSGQGAEANFLSAPGLGSAGTITLDANRTVGQIAFNNTHGYSITSGTGGPWTLTIDDTHDPYGAAHPLITVSSGSQTIAANISLANGLTIDTAAAGSMNISGNITGSGNLNITGTGAVTLSGTNSISNSKLTVASGASLNFAGNSGGTTLVRSFESLNISGSVKIGPFTGSAHSVVVIGTGGLTDTGKLDLFDNDLIVKSSNADTVADQLKSHSIVSTSAATNIRFLTTLGVRQSPGGVFDSITTTTSDVLVKYTYYGDADLNGTVNGADYAQIDNGFGMHLTGWTNGDFNYDGVVNGSDYSLIDNTFNQITATGASPLSIIASSFSSSDVPEPTALGLSAIAAIGIRRTRRHLSEIE